MRCFPILGGAALIFASPALADWNYTRWGMSPAEVVAASKGQARLSKPNKDTNTVFGSTGAEGDYSQPPFDFHTVFLFRYDKLTQVTLHVKDGKDCTPLANDLIRRFGPPEIASLATDYTRFFWSNTPTANDIRVLRLPAACAIVYVQHGVVPARSPEGRARPDNFTPGPKQNPPQPKAPAPSLDGNSPKNPA
jgi:hypothetical protein